MAAYADVISRCCSLGPSIWATTLVCNNHSAIFQYPRELTVKGHPFIGEMDEELKAAIEKIRVAAEKAGKASGMYCSNGTDARKWADAGFGMVRTTRCPGDTSEVAQLTVTRSPSQAM